MLTITCLGPRTGQVIDGGEEAKNATWGRKGDEEKEGGTKKEQIERNKEHVQDCDCLSDLLGDWKPKTWSQTSQ